MNTLDFNIHRNNLVSIKDLQEDIKLSDGKWDLVFDPLIKNCECVYFRGHRLYFKDEVYEKAVEVISDKMIFDLDDHMNILFRINLSHLLISRKYLSVLWQYYEYPAMLFLHTGGDESKLPELFMQKMTFDEIASLAKGLYIVHRSFEQNVLWVQNSKGVPSVNSLYEPSGSYGSSSAQG